MDIKPLPTDPGVLDRIACAAAVPAFVEAMITERDPGHAAAQLHKTSYEVMELEPEYRRACRDGRPEAVAALLDILKSAERRNGELLRQPDMHANMLVELNTRERALVTVRKYLGGGFCAAAQSPTHTAADMLKHISQLKPVVRFIEDESLKEHPDSVTARERTGSRQLAVLESGCRLAADSGRPETISKLRILLQTFVLATAKSAFRPDAHTRLLERLDERVRELAVTRRAIKGMGRPPRSDRSDR